MKYWRVALAVWLLFMGLVQALALSFLWMGWVLGGIAVAAAILLILDR